MSKTNLTLFYFGRPISRFLPRYTHTHTWHTHTHTHTWEIFKLSLSHPLSDLDSEKFPAVCSTRSFHLIAVHLNLSAIKFDIYFIDAYVCVYSVVKWEFISAMPAYEIRLKSSRVLDVYIDVASYVIELVMLLSSRCAVNANLCRCWLINTTPFHSMYASYISILYS